MKNFKIIAQNNILKSFSQEDSLEKGKKMPIGTVSNGRKKIAEGKWIVVHEDGYKHSEHENKKSAIDTKNDENRSLRSLTGQTSAFKVLSEKDFKILSSLREDTVYNKAKKIKEAKSDREIDFLWQFIVKSGEEKQIHEELKTK